MEIIERLEATKAATLKYYGLGDEHLVKSYGPGKWTVRYILHHLADAETVLYDRVRRVISEPKQVLWAFDESAWAKGLDYANVPLELSRRIYSSVRDGIIYQARLHYEDSGHLEFVHNETGVRTLKEEFDKVATHNQHHLEQIKMALDAS
ncbi:MAG TPA: DinB family protein [Pyrinomonadaceae bacterium]|nr:DinB family protein [Pyrinomonadaceae bacterium]